MFQSLNVLFCWCLSLLAPAKASIAGDELVVVAPLSLLLKKQQRLKLLLAVCQTHTMASSVCSAKAFAETKMSKHAKQKLCNIFQVGPCKAIFSDFEKNTQLKSAGTFSIIERHFSIIE